MPHEPKKRHSRARQGKRRASIKFKKSEFLMCPNCKNPTLPHMVCKICGYYDGKQVIALKVKKEKTA